MVLTVGAGLCAWGAAGLFAVVWFMAAARRERLVRACHELRGSITAAQLGLELGTRTGDGSEGRRRAIELELEKAALALDDLVSVVLGQGGPAHQPGLTAAEPVDLADLLADSVEAWHATAAVHGAELSLRCPGPQTLVVGDRLRLAQATGNLIANAIEHGGGAVEVRLRSDRSAVRVEVIDGGAGLPEPLEQLVRRARRGRGGRGRGLAIAAAIAEAHRGRLGVAPSDRGARMVLELPASPASCASA
jgi:signal transduction histidine kinase